MTGASGSTDARGLAERVFDGALGLSLAGWGTVHGLRQMDAASTLGNWGVQAAFIALSIVVGVLLILRRPPKVQGGPRAMAYALPTVLLGGWVTHAVTPSNWTVSAAVFVILGVSLAGSAFLSLGECFAVLPSVRGVVNSGPYRWVRHPAYSGELLILAACCLAQPTWGMGLGLIAGLVLIVPRIRAEEGLLGGSAEYLGYRDRVPYRLVPGVY